MDDSRLQSTLLGWILPLAITISILLRRKKDLRQKMFILFSGNVTVFYFFSFLYDWQGEPWFERAALATAVLIPQGGLRFFRAFSSGARGMGRLGGVAAALGLLLLVAVLHPSAPRPAVGPAVLAYVLGFMLVAILNLNVQAKEAPTRVDAARIRYLVTLGLLTLSFQCFDRLDNIFALHLPPIGLAMTVIYLYIISQTLVLYRILDLHETMGRFAVLFLMGIALAAIYGTLVFWVGSGFSINAFLASLVILILFNPLSDIVEQKIAEVFFLERHVLDDEAADVRRKLAHIIDMDAMIEVLKEGLEHSKRLTHAGLFLLDAHGRGYDLQLAVGPQPPMVRIESAAARMHLVPQASSKALLAASLSSYRERLLQIGERDKARSIRETLDLMGSLQADVLLLVEGDDQLLGVLTLRDERRTDPFSPEDVDLLQGLAGQIAVTVENSRMYKQTKERDRLAALGSMAAGLAHEIRNPLGSIKGAAQVIEELVSSGAPTEEFKDLLSVVVEEADRLNRVVFEFLMYARPTSGKPQVLNVNQILERSIQVFQTRPENTVTVNTELTPDLDLVQMDGERLHQVFLNLMLNAAEADGDRSKRRIEISTHERLVRSMFAGSSYSDKVRRFVEIRFSDNGPGLSPDIIENIFIPFFTTKESGSGLGLSICLRIVRDAGGDIEVESRKGQGAVFTVVLPSAKEKLQTDSSVDR
jgi:nitrogen-specific signal transduction histidine kinase